MTKPPSLKRNKKKTNKQTKKQTTSKRKLNTDCVPLFSFDKANKIIELRLEVTQEFMQGLWCLQVKRKRWN